MRNGRTFRDYSSKDMEELHRIAILRKVCFTIVEIHMMQEHPELILAIYENDLKHLREEAAELAQLCRVAETIPPETMGSDAAVPSPTRKNHIWSSFRPL